MTSADDQRLTTENLAVLLPTGKPHVSFSELSMWVKCTHKHFLRHIKKIDLDKASPALSIGTAQHNAIERAMPEGKIEEAISHSQDLVTADWELNSEFEEQRKLEAVKEALASITREFSGFLTENVGPWTRKFNEVELFEPVQDSQFYFKGFIDLVIEYDNGRILVIDMKTCQKPWSTYKKNDDVTQMQLTLYRYFYAQKFSVPQDNIDVAFVTLNIAEKKCSELIKVVVSEEMTAKALKSLRTFYKSVSRGIHLKNRTSCAWCPYKLTENCKGVSK
jgi:hypothetical protein